MSKANSWMGKIWNAKYPPAKNVDTFIKLSPKVSQAKLQQLRQLIKTVVPQAEEGISYRMPVFKFHGQQLVGFAGYEHHLGFYPMSGSFLNKYKKELKDFKTSKGAVQFPLDRPLPVTLIKKMIKDRIKQII